MLPVSDESSDSAGYSLLSNLTTPVMFSLTPTRQRWPRTVALAAVMLVTATATSRLQAQTPTPENTVITNTASVSWTDANSNTYAPVTASSSVTVGFTAGVTVASPATVTPASPSTGNTVVFTITNGGNGTDQEQVKSLTAASGITITGYTFNSTSYATLALLNTAMAAANVVQGGTETVTVAYSVASSQGGITLPIVATVSSNRTPATTSTATTNVIPPTGAGVTVTPSPASPITQLPSNGTSYTVTYVVTNTGNASDTYTLAAASSSGTNATITQVNGVSGTAGSVTLAAGATSNVIVTYTVGNVAAGSTSDLSLKATSGNTTTVNATGDYTLTVIRAAITMTKQAYKDDQTTAINSTTDRVLPGQFIQYKITITNGGTSGATTVAVTDALPAAVTYQSATGDLTGWTFGFTSPTVTGTLTGTLAPAASRFFWVRVVVK